MKKVLYIGALLFSISFLSCIDSGESSQNSKELDFSKLKEGDVVFQELSSYQCQAVKKATNSKYSHMGIVLYKDGKPYVYEGIGPVKFTEVGEWIARGKDAHVSIKRLKNYDEIMTKDQIEKMRKKALSLKGRSYDFQFNWSDHQIYCSELVYKVFEAIDIELGEKANLETFNLDDPAVKQILKERYGDNIPYEEPCVSPQSIFEDADLEVFYQN